MIHVRNDMNSPSEVRKALGDLAKKLQRLVAGNTEKDCWRFTIGMCTPHQTIRVSS